jgi:predicted tellurium resistance membrane protein TerC
MYGYIYIYNTYMYIYIDMYLHSQQDISENAVVKLAKNFLKTTDQFDGEKFFTVIDGIKYATPLFLCLVCVELSDVVFAFDSVPAVRLIF